MLPIILYRNLFSQGVPTASGTDAAAAFDILNVNDLRPYTYWQADAYGTLFLYPNISAKADAFGIVGHNLGTAGALISVEYSDTGAWAGEEVEQLAPFVPADDLTILKTFPLADGYWRLKIVTAAVVPFCGVVMIGEALEMPTPPDTPYIPFTEDTKASALDSKTGQLLGVDVRYFPIKIRPRWSKLLRSFAFDEYQDFWNDHARWRKPFLYGWDLDTFPEHAFFVRHKGKHGVPLTVLSLADKISLDLIGVNQ